jgi:hypothetical protein
MTQAHKFVAIAFTMLAVTAAGNSAQAQCVGGDVLAFDTLHEADIPSLSALQAAQIVEAVRESAHTDVTTVEEAFDRVDDNEVNQIVLYDESWNQFYTEMEFGAGGNSYGAIFYWGFAIKVAAIHDGFQEECGYPGFNYDRGDTAPECTGFLDYCNTATFAELDAYLPSNVATNIVNARTAHPFASVADVVAVNGVGEVRLQQLLAHARSEDFVGTDCSGIYDQIAISVTQEDAMVSLINEMNREELEGVFSYYIDQSVVDILLDTRPYGNAQEIANTFEVGPATFRTLRNRAIIVLPFEELVGVVNAINRPDAQVRFDQHFEWLPYLSFDDHAGLEEGTCFGIDSALLPAGVTNRPELADGDEVTSEFAEWVMITNVLAWFGYDADPGLTDLAHRTDGHEFFGCYLTFHPNPWQYETQIFFIDVDNGRSYLITFHYVE